MITFAAPGFLLAGALLALVPLALHMLARTPPERQPLPTARFLTADRRTQLRIRRPTDLLLLALRVAFIVLLAAAFARPEWLPERTGESVVVLLDTGAEMAPVWGEAVAAARERLGADGVLILFDSTARVVADPDAALDSLATVGPGAGTASYLAALRGLKSAAGTIPAESATAVLVTRPRWGAWSPGVATARETAWRARIDVVAVGTPPAARLDRAEEQADGAASGVDGASPGVNGGADSGEVLAAALVGPDDHPLRPYATAALRVLGFAPGSDTARLVVVLGDTGATAPRRIPEAPHVVFLGGGMPSLAEADGPAPWTGPPSSIEWAEAAKTLPPGRGRLVLPGGRAMEGWVARGGEAAAGSVVVAVWEDGRPAAAASRSGGSCYAYLAAEPGTPAAAADPAFPWLLRALATACTPQPLTVAAAGGEMAAVEEAALDDVPLAEAALDGALGALPLDQGALTILRGDALPDALDLLSAEGPRRRSLARLLTVLALLVALTEAAIAYGWRWGR